MGALARSDSKRLCIDVFVYRYYYIEYMYNTLLRTTAVVATVLDLVYVGTGTRSS